MTITIFLELIWLHYVADFLLQTRSMAENKADKNKWLGLHATVYAFPFLLFGWKFALFTGVAHFVVDWITSRITKYFWTEKKVRRFFNTIGMDQAIHFTILILTYRKFFL